MTTYTYAQLESLWIQGGGSSTVAPIAAAIALAESEGNSLAAYPGTTVAPGKGSWTDATGLWQILGAPGGTAPGGGAWQASQLTDPLANAQMAVAKYEQAGNSFGPWQTYTSGAYSKYLKSGVPPVKVSGTSSASTSSTSSTNAASPTDQGLISDVTGLAKEAGTLVHDAAEVLNFAFEFFKPGQGFRIGMGAAAVASGAAAVSLYTGVSVGASVGPSGVRPSARSRSSTSADAPIAILLTAVALITAYMALRPWPITNGRPMRAAAYVHDILGGQPPVGVPPSQDTAAIEAGLWAVLGIWAASKAAGAFSSAASGLGGIIAGIGKLLGGLGKTGEEVATVAGEAGA